ncbi:hypothetical protein [uncultured Algibacter sp.]|uniref:hypothetical protein n=1 Tax=uncultured Algibacter sp. TaxID=298659 RepID=UPI002622F56A|nr:hypothetical protein [uncultured Algibacter sp.]
MKLYVLLFIVLVSFSCKESNKINEEHTLDIINKKKEPKKETKTKETYLCTINGKPWHYTKASGIVSRHKKTKKREAIFTFTKKLEKGKEIVQLFYDGDTNQLEKANIHLKVLKKDGKRMTAMYTYSSNTTKFHPNAKISGAIDLSNPSNASGNAEISKLDVRFDKNEVKNEADKIISAQGINFKGIGYSEAGKLFGSKGGASNN